MKDPVEESTPEQPTPEEPDDVIADEGESLTEEKSENSVPQRKHFSVFAGKQNSSADSDKEGSPVHVVTRVRPLNPQEIDRKDNDVIEFAGNGALFVKSGKSKSFGFDAVFEKECKQTDVFNNCDIKRLVDMAIDGYACTAFAFGQTGSGKTYTMTGPVTPESTTQEHAKSLRNPDNYGLIQYCFSYVMKQIEAKDVTSVKASYMEIYNEQVQDLLNPYGFDNVQVRWSKATGFYVENLLMREIEDLDELMDVLEDGMKNRSVAAHNVNEHSSRSHSILTVHIDSEGVEEGIISVTKHGKISFVDLAGSEKVKETGSTGDTLTEATNINRSLLTLGNCISALSDSKKRSGHIPFRDSKLTKLLADSLGGSGATLMNIYQVYRDRHAMAKDDDDLDNLDYDVIKDILEIYDEIACVSPSAHNVSETLNTLRYAKRAKKIKNKPVIRMDPREELILKLQREMHLIKQENLFLRNQLHFPQREKPRHSQPGESQHIARMLPKIPVARSNGRPTTENSLYEMLQEYMVENESLRHQNQGLMSQHSKDERDHRIISRDNDRLSDKLEEMQRLVLSSPLIRNSQGFNTRTNSGHSYLSLHSYEDSTFTPVSQFYGHPNPGFGPNGVNYPNYATGHHGNHPRRIPAVALRQQNPPRHAWENNANAELPPLRGSPPLSRKQPGQANQQRMTQQENSESKWDKSRSYAQQLKEKQAWHRINNGDIARKQKKPHDVMRDFPLRDLSIPRHHAEQFRNPQPIREFPQQDHRLDHPSPELNHSRMAMQLQRGRAGVLPKDAYKARDVSPRGSMLSATSLRRMNKKIRREMRDLDNRITNEKRQQRPGPS